MAVLAPAFARTPIIGYSQNPPMTWQRADGQPAGFAVDVLNAAAQRAHLTLTWRFAPSGLASGEVNLWPAGADTPGRRERFYITSPWWSTGLLLVSRDPLEGASLAGRRILAPGDVLRAITGKLAGATMDRAATHESGMRDMCSGAADGFVTDRIILDRLLLHRPAECGSVALSLTGVPDASLELHILASPDWKPEADRLYAAIDALKRDGTAAQIAFRYPGISSGSAAFLASLQEATHQNQSLRRALWVAGVTLLVLGAIVFWLLEQVRARRRTEAELLIVNRELKETNSDLEQFNYAASHDLSEPLRNMSLYSELLVRRYSNHLDDTGRRHVLVIREGALRLEQLLDGLRRYSMLSWNNEQALANAAKVLHDVIETLRPAIEESGAVVTGDKLPVVPMQPAWLMQVLQNLISNAIKYRGSDVPVVHVSAERRDGFWVFAVKDNGVGIRPEYQERVFAVFKRLHGREVPGTGIGLAICRKIVDRQGGRIWVESNVDGPGSTFRFTIPVERTSPRPGAAVRG